MSNNPAGHEHIYILQDLDIPDAPRVKEAEKYSSGRWYGKGGVCGCRLLHWWWWWIPHIEGDGDIQSTFGSTSSEYPFGNVFWTCSDMFNAGRWVHEEYISRGDYILMIDCISISNQRGSRRVFLITNQDNPHPNQHNLRQAAIRRAKVSHFIGTKTISTVWWW